MGYNMVDRWSKTKRGSIMAHQMTIHNLGPISDCSLELKRFTVLAGPQSNGKSTIAKSVFFFRTVKQDILQIIKM